ncbi:MAG: hypothetical protein R3F62_18830 [Planctomycetota bacterium]
MDLDRFVNDPEALALRVERRDLPGLLKKKLTVPGGCVALVTKADGVDVMLTAGEETPELESALLVREEVDLELSCPAGRSQDGMELTLSVGLTLNPRPALIDLGQLKRNVLSGESQASKGALEAFYRPYLQAAVRLYCSGRTTQDLVERLDGGDFEGHLREELKKALFESGCVLANVRHPAFTSDDYERQRKQALEHGEKERALKQEQELLELRKQLDMQAVLAGLEVQDEADRTRKEQRLARYEELRTRMGDDDVKALILLLDDDAQRAKLIRELINKDVTPEQRAAVQVGEMEGKVEGRLRELQQRLAQLTGAELQRDENDPITRRVLAVVGKRVLSFDPKTNLHPEVPKEVYDTEEGNLGYLRSARWETIAGEGYVLAGAQRGVYAIGPQGVQAFPYPSTPQGKGGANSVAYFDGRIYATHSESGLWEWPLAGGEGRQLCEAESTAASATRGVVVERGVLYFSAGADVFALDLARGSETAVRYKGSDDSITSFVVVGDELVAGNRSGRIYSWALDDPGSAHAFDVLKKNPIYMLRHTRLAGTPFFVIGSKDFTVTLAEPRKNLFRDYQAREEVRWVDAASDYVIGVSRSGYKLFCWDAHHQSQPKLTIRVADKIQDLFVVRALPKGATT